jgi:pimeloyl-ACP methyl ester carboxylesterase
MMTRGRPAPANEGLLWAACAAINCPAVLVHAASSDIISREGMVRMAATIPDEHLVEVDAGHVIPLEDPAGFCDAVTEFL